jgi:hypothetical protein
MDLMEPSTLCEISITNRSEYVSKIAFIDTKKFIDVFNVVIYPIINQRYYDDDFPSITLSSNKKLYEYYYIGNNQWLYRETYENALLTNKTDKKILSWSEILS